MRRVFLIHGWGGSPENDWFPWASKTLNAAGFDVKIPRMPDADNPKIGPWVKMLDETVGKPESTDIFVGHSIGCQTILRYLQKLNEDQNVKKVILIAPWWYLTLGETESMEVAEPWLKSFVDFTRLKKRASEFICIFSENDPWVPFKKNLEFFRKKLNPEIIVKSGLGHFTEDEGSNKIEFLLDLVI